jgi:hypothetical protein
MLYFLVTTCLFNDCPTRMYETWAGITKLKKLTKDMNCKIIIIENNGKRPTMLDKLGEVFYTNNNSLTFGKGVKELKDIFDCMRHYDIKDDDFIVKMTGRYLLDDKCPFITSLKYMLGDTDCIIRFGPYYAPVMKKMNDCITGLFGMRCKYVKEVKGTDGCIEWEWGRVASSIPDERVFALDKLGILINPGGEGYYAV